MVLGASITCGVLSHILCYHLPPNSLSAFAAILFLPPVALSYAYASSFARSLVTYLLALTVSIVAYRLSPFHPLAAYPGPRLARISRFWATHQVLKGRQHILSHTLFAQYGNVVRTGPNHLIIRDGAAVPVVLGARNQWPKHTYYIVGLPYGNAGHLLSQLDPAVHNKRRRVWDRAFTPGAIAAYEPFLQRRVRTLLAQLDARAGQSIDIAEWLGFVTMDFMGDFACGGAFDATARGEDKDGFHALAITALRALEALGAVPWLRALVARAPSDANKFLAMAMGVLHKRRAEGSSVRDLFHHLMDEDGEGVHAPLDDPTLASEASLAIVAGSDTTSMALANALFYLISHPASMTRLRAELDGAAPPGEDVAPGVLGGLPYLQAVLSETLRLQPAVPNGVQRTPPPEGGPVVVAGYVVPVGTAVQIPTWSIHHDPRYFSPDPDEFWPERWLPDEGPKLAASRGTAEFVLNQTAYMPFSYGPTNCVGRALAQHEMRTILAALVRRFDMHFAPGFSPADWEAQLRDAYVLVRGKLPVVLGPRA